MNETLVWRRVVCDQPNRFKGPVSWYVCCLLPVVSQDLYLLQEMVLMKTDELETENIPLFISIMYLLLFVKYGIQKYFIMSLSCQKTYSSIKTKKNNKNNTWSIFFLPKQVWSDQILLLTSLKCLSRSLQTTQHINSSLVINTWHNPAKIQPVVFPIYVAIVAIGVVMT